MSRDYRKESSMLIPTPGSMLGAVHTANLKGCEAVQIYGAKGCDLCIVSGGCSRPSNLSSDVIAVREEWLLKGAEQYKLESERLHAVT